MTTITLTDDFKRAVITVIEEMRDRHAAAELEPVGQGPQFISAWDSVSTACQALEDWMLEPASPCQLDVGLGLKTVEMYCAAYVSCAMISVASADTAEDRAAAKAVVKQYLAMAQAFSRGMSELNLTYTDASDELLRIQERDA